MESALLLIQKRYTTTLRFHCIAWYYSRIGSVCVLPVIAMELVALRRDKIVYFLLQERYRTLLLFHCIAW